MRTWSDNAERSNSILMAPYRTALCRNVAVTLVLLCLGLAGCASVGTSHPATAQATAAASQTLHQPTNGWWAARFRMNWPEGTDPAWHLDELIAYEIISPALEQYRDQILLWRFHRRAARDDAGHQFSFIFYSTPQSAELIYAAIRSNPLIDSLKAHGYVLQASYSDTNKVTQPNIEDTADPSWSLPLKRAWPNFIMGVSEAWLILISEYAGERSNPDQSAHIDQLVSSFVRVHAAVEKTWKDEGAHAFLHHLNALFGYSPVVIRGDSHLMRF